MATATTPQRNRLTQAQVRFFKQNGYLIGLPPVYGPADVAMTSDKDKRPPEFQPMK